MRYWLPKENQCLGNDTQTGRGITRAGVPTKQKPPCTLTDPNVLPACHRHNLPHVTHMHTLPRTIHSAGFIPTMIPLVHHPGSTTSTMLPLLHPGSTQHLVACLFPPTTNHILRTEGTTVMVATLTTLLPSSPSIAFLLGLTDITGATWERCPPHLRKAQLVVLTLMR